MAHAACGQSMDRSTRDVLANQTPQDPGLAAALPSRAAVQPPALVTAVQASIVDARGAPHLTSVIRI